ncbi:MAG: hypothetical protein AB4426_26000 [Xenococcaceae cyanobacterium]
MTIKEQLIHEIEQAPDIVIEEVFDFFLLAKLKGDCYRRGKKKGSVKIYKTIQNSWCM